MVFITKVRTYMCNWSSDMWQAIVLFFSFWYKLIVGLWGALEEEAAKQEFLSVPTQSSVYTVHQRVSIHQQCTKWCLFIRNRVHQSGGDGAPPPAEAVVTALHWAPPYQSLPLNKFHCICNILSVAFSVWYSQYWVSCWLILIYLYCNANVKIQKLPQRCCKIVQNREGCIANQDGVNS